MSEIRTSEEMALNTLCIFSLRFSVYFLRCWQGEFESLIISIILMTSICDSGGGTLRRIYRLVSVRGQRIKMMLLSGLVQWRLRREIFHTEYTLIYSQYCYRIQMIQTSIVVLLCISAIAFWACILVGNFKNAQPRETSPVSARK